MEGSVIKNLLNQRVKDVCRYLLPNGKEERGEWSASNVRDVSSKGTPNTGSLRVSLVGSKCGLWKDHADPAMKGDIIRLWMECKGVNFREALKQAADFVGYKPVKDSSFRKNLGQKAPPKPKKLEEKIADLLKPIVEGSRPWKWLTEDRGISPEAIRAYGIGMGKYPYQKDAPLCVVFPFVDSMGDLQMLKWRDPDDKSFIRTTSKSRKVLFGIPAIPENQEVMYIVEGELDALSLWDLGYPAVSVPYGAKLITGVEGDPNSEWIEHDYDNWIAPHTSIVFATDADEVGREASESAARRLGREKCKILNWPDGIKDANEYIMKGYGAEDFTEEVLAEAGNLDPKSLKTAKEYRNKIWECFYPSDEGAAGDPLPFGDSFPFRFRPGEVTVWTGYSKHGKTVLLNYMLVHLTQYHRRSCLCSLEMKPEKNLQAILRMGLGRSKPDDEKQFDFALDWANKYFWVYDKVGTANPDEVLEVFGYAAKKYGISHFVIDSLMRLDIPEDEDAQLKHLMNKLCDFATAYNVHVHIVAHSKKPDMKRPENKGWPSKHMVRGSVHITNIAHNVVVVWRNKGKEEAYYKCLNTGNMDLYKKDWQNQSDATFAVLAQRENGEEPVRNLYFDKESWHYKNSQNESSLIYAR
jgi:twinkle protein